MHRSATTRRAIGAALAAAALAGCAQVSGLGSRAQIATTPRCTDFFFAVYFADRSADLTKPAQAVIANAGSHAAGCPAASVEVVGLADYRGPAEPNLELSRARAERVAAALAKGGLPGPSFKLSAVGEAGALAGDAAKPLRRRADVYVRFAR
ncbi:MAG: OmpA/MotB domain protein [Caulobacteraceae bacterium]|nr:OmpA/MotB domain protein [Caulobacteraceae bacterium]